MVVPLRSVTNRGEGYYADYKGYYASGQLKEEGKIFVECYDQPFPDRHMVWEGKYYRPDGTLGSTVSQGTGTQTLWYPNGQVMWELELVNGKRVHCKQFMDDGKTRLNIEYVDEKEVYLPVD